MDRLNELYDVANENGIDIYNFPLPNTGSMSIEVNGHCCIGMDSTRRFTRAEEAARLGHEIGTVSTAGSTPGSRHSTSENATRSGPTAGTYSTRYRKKRFWRC